jgi:hypothetical protein
LKKLFNPKNIKPPICFLSSIISTVIALPASITTAFSSK